jgi:hypothetical protein
MLTLLDGSYKEWREEEVGFWLLAAVPSRFECGVHPQFVLIGCGNIVHDAALLELDPLRKAKLAPLLAPHGWKEQLLAVCRAWSVEL